jgi:protein phosphatase 1 regulatory subunit 7
LELTHLQLVNSSLPPLHLPRFGSHLKRLCLRQNRLTSLDPEVFEALTELEELDFYDNRIGYLEGFEKLTKLT